MRYGIQVTFLLAFQFKLWSQVLREHFRLLPIKKYIYQSKIAVTLQFAIL